MQDLQYNYRDNQCASGGVRKQCADSGGRFAYRAKYAKEATSKASAKVQSKRTTRITETIETGREDRVTRFIRNGNQCHTLTFDFFETLANYEVELEFHRSRLRLVAMLRNPFTHSFTDSDAQKLIRSHETALANALIDPAVAGGFEACRTIAAYEKAKTIVSDRANSAKQQEGVNNNNATDLKTTAKDPSPQESAVIEIMTQIQGALKTIHSEAQYQLAIDAIDINDFENAPVTQEMRERFQYWLFVQLCSAKFPGLLSVFDRIRDSAPILIADARALVSALPDIGGALTLAGLGALSDIDKEAAGLATAIHSKLGLPGRWKWFSDRCREENLYTPNDLGLGKDLRGSPEGIPGVRGQAR